MDQKTAREKRRVVNSHGVILDTVINAFNVLAVDGVRLDGRLSFYFKSSKILTFMVMKSFRMIQPCPKS